MERKFASRLNQLKPAAQARKQASSAVKETIQSNQFKSVEPIDYDDYVETNFDSLKRDAQYKPIVLLPTDDIYIQSETHDNNYEILKEGTLTSLNEILTNNVYLFVRDCLHNYELDKYLVKYRYHNYGGNYKQLPNVNEQNLLLNTKNLNYHLYEIDYESTKLYRGKNTVTTKENNEKSLTLKRQAPKVYEKQGWIQYKTYINKMEQNKMNSLKNLKRRYFYLHVKLTSQNDKLTENSSYVLECFKDNKKNDSQFYIDVNSNIRLNKCQTTCSIELSFLNNDIIYHLNIENTKEFDEWCEKFDSIVSIFSDHNASNIDAPSKQAISPVTPVKEFLNNHLNESPISPTEDDSKYVTNYNNPSQKTSFDFNKYLNENDEDLVKSCKIDENINPFSLYAELKLGEPPTEETELESDWPEKEFGRKLLLECIHLKFSLNFNTKPDEYNLNPEPFFVTFALYDAVNNQKLSENFHWNPNSKYLNDMIYLNNNNVPQSEISAANNSLFSLDGKFLLNPNYETSLYEHANKQINKVSKAIFTILNQHEEIYLIARIEKILDGKEYNTSIKPYLNRAQSYNKNVKLALRLNKKMKTICTTKLGVYRMPFAWAIKPVYKKVTSFIPIVNTHTSLRVPNSSTTCTFHYALDDSEFQIYQQDTLHLGDEDLFRYLSDFRLKEKYFNGKLIPINAKLDVKIIDMKASNAVNLINCISSSSYLMKNKKQFEDSELTLEIESFDLKLPPQQLQQIQPQQTHIQLLTTLPINTNEFFFKTKLLQPNFKFKNFLYVYPKFLKYETQRAFAKARNIMVSIEFRENDSINSKPLKCIYNYPYAVSNSSELFSTQYFTYIIHHNKNPQYYEEIKILLPINLNESHHLLFKFYHISCQQAKNTHQRTSKTNTSTLPVNNGNMNILNVNTSTSLPPPNASPSSLVNNSNIESLVGMAWLPIYKNGRLLIGEKLLPVAQNLTDNYLKYENTETLKIIQSSDIKWIDGMKQIFKLELSSESTIYVNDSHVGNFFIQCEKLFNKIQSNKNEDKIHLAEDNDILEIPTDSFKEILKNSIKALHATDITTIIKYSQVIIDRIFKLLIIDPKYDVSIHVIRALLHYVNELSSIGKLNILKSYIKYTFNIEYTQKNDSKTVHEELIQNLYIFIKQIYGRDQLLMIRILKTCWFYLEITIKSICIYSNKFKNCDKNTEFTYTSKLFNDDFYISLNNLYEILIEFIIKLASNTKLQDTDLINAYKSCNRSLGMFIKKALNLLNRKFLFNLINKYLENFHPSDNKQLYEIKFDFIRIICNHEHYIPFNLPLSKPITNINEFSDFKSEFILTDQYRQIHFLSGTLLSQLCISLNENKDLRKPSIHVFRNILCKHSFDPRYRDKFKQHRIASLYLPYIDILIENLSRFNVSQNSLASTSNSSNAVKSSLTAISIQNGSIISSYSSSTVTSSNTLTQQLSNDFSNESFMENECKLRLKSANENVLGVIAGITNIMRSDNTDSILSDTESLSSVEDKSSIMILNSEKKQYRSSFISSENTDPSTANSIKSYLVTRNDKFDTSEIKDLLICAIYILKNLNQDTLLALWCNYNEYEFIEFINMLDLCLNTFRYRGKAYIKKLNGISKTKDMKAIIKSPRKMGDPVPYKHEQMNATKSLTIEDEIFDHILIESSLCYEISNTVLNILSLFIIHYKDKLNDQYGLNAITRRVLETYLHLLETDQSERVKLNTIASFRILVNIAPGLFMDPQTTYCASLCAELLKCFNSNLSSIRYEASVLLYLLLRKNYEYTGYKSIMRTHLQVTVCVSQLINGEKIKNNKEFNDYLDLLNALSLDDVLLKDTSFLLEIKDLTKRLKNILISTVKLEALQDDPEVHLDALYTLAKSYSNTPTLRMTWLLEMAAHCFLHVAGMIAEHLKSRGLYTPGCTVFRKIAPNIETEEANRKIDHTEHSDINEIRYAEEDFLIYLLKAADMLQLGDRLEALPDIFKLAIVIYERNKNYEKLQEMHNNIQKTYLVLSDPIQYKEKPLGTYYRVCFYGKVFNDENNKVYIYKELGSTKLCEICERLRKSYTKRYPHDIIEILNDSRKPQEIELDISINNYIQVTFVQPYFEESDMSERSNNYERNTNINKFFYDFPYQLKDSDDSKNERPQHFELLRLCKKKLVLQTSHWFPYVVKRILVVYERSIDLNPLETAIDELRQKTDYFQQVLKKKDFTLLNLVLQGTIIPQVHKGPLSYAEAFLDINESLKYSNQLIIQFKSVFKSLIEAVRQGIDLYTKLSTPNDKTDDSKLTVNISGATTIDILQLIHDKFYEFEHKFKQLSEQPHLKQCDEFIQNLDGSSNETMKLLNGITTSASDA